MMVNLVFLPGIFWLCMVPVGSAKRSKRIVNGEPITMDAYQTYLYVQIRRSWACVTDQTLHDLTPCQVDGNICGGALIHPEFVITAAQCLMYYEVQVKMIGKHPSDWDEDVKGGPDSLLDDVSEAANELWGIVAYVILPKPKHTVYSDWALLVGSDDSYKMTEKRHVVSVYPHSKFPILDKTDPTAMKEFRNTQNLFHDVGLLRACEPFKVVQHEVELANTLQNANALQKQYDLIIAKGEVCLYMGFGPVDIQPTKHLRPGTEFRLSGDHLGTWARSKLKHTWRWGEAYTWTNVNCCVHNIIVGKLWIEQYGTMEIVNAVTGHKAVLTFKPAGWFSKDLHRVEGFIMDKNKKKLHFLYGKWTDFIRVTDYASYESYFKDNAHKFRSANDSKSPASNSESPSQTPKKVLAKLNSLKVGFKSQTSISEPDEGGPVEPGGSDIPKCDSTYSIDIPNSTTLWEATPRPPNSAEYYQFTLFAMSLNEMLPGMEKKICPTDCRLRPDIKKLEHGDLDGAAAEKTRLEEQQRDARKARKGKKGNDWKPRWFCQGTNPYTSSEDWLYTGGYWDRNYGPDPQIF